MNPHYSPVHWHLDAVALQSVEAHSRAVFGGDDQQGAMAMRKMLVLFFAAMAVLALGVLPAAAQVSGSGDGFNEPPPDEIAPEGGVDNPDDDVTAAGDDAVAAVGGGNAGLAATGFAVTTGMVLASVLVALGALALMLARRRPAPQS